MAWRALPKKMTIGFCIGCAGDWGGQRLSLRRQAAAAEAAVVPPPRPSAASEKMLLAAPRGGCPFSPTVILSAAGGAVSSVTSAVCGAAAQAAEGIDVRRTVLWGAGVAVLQVPIFHAWFRFADARFAQKTVAEGVKKWVLESVSVGPAYLALVSFYGDLVVRRGYAEAERPLERAAGSVATKFPDAIVTAYCTIAPAQLFSHIFVPPVYKLLYLNTVSALWNTLLSQIVCDDKAEAAAESVWQAKP